MVINMKKTDLAIIVPCYNEEEILPQSIKKLNKLLSSLIEKNLISNDSCIVFVNDGSKDKTWDIIKKENKKNPFIKGICLSRNFGHQEALLAGLYNIKKDIYITIDADLQDDINVIKDMIIKYHEGNM